MVKEIKYIIGKVQRLGNLVEEKNVI